MTVEEAARYWAERDQADQARKRRRGNRAAQMVHAARKQTIIASAERFSNTVRWFPGEYRQPKWQLVRIRHDQFENGDQSFRAGGLSIAWLCPGEDGNPFAVAYSLLLNRNVQVPSHELTWLEAPSAPTFEAQTNAKLPHMADAIANLAPEQYETVTTDEYTNQPVSSDSVQAPGGRTTHVWIERARHMGRLDWEETTFPDGTVQYDVLDEDESSGTGATVSAARNQLLIARAYTRPCDICGQYSSQIAAKGGQYPAVIVVAGTGLDTPDPWPICVGCYLERPFVRTVDVECDLDILDGDLSASCLEHAGCFGRCYRITPSGQHLHLVATESGPMVVGVRASGADWFELVGRPMLQADYINAVCEA